MDVARPLLLCLALALLGCGGERTSASSSTVSPPPTTTEPPTTAEPATTSEPASDEAPTTTTGLGSADSDERFACTADSDCVIAPATSCCPSCCDCPTVMRRDAWEQMQRICAVASCRGNDCRSVRCEPCGIITVVHCVAGRCTPS